LFSLLRFSFFSTLSNVLERVSKRNGLGYWQRLQLQEHSDYQTTAQQFLPAKCKLYKANVARLSR
jgi:hypothetical protein